MIFTSALRVPVSTPANGSDSVAPTRSHAIAERRNQPLPTGGRNNASPHDAGVNQVCRSNCVICARE